MWWHVRWGFLWCFWGFVSENFGSHTKNTNETNNIMFCRDNVIELVSEFTGNGVFNSGCVCLLRFAGISLSFEMTLSNWNLSNEKSKVFSKWTPDNNLFQSKNSKPIRSSNYHKISQKSLKSLHPTCKSFFFHRNTYFP